MDKNDKKIGYLIGALSEAHWQRARQPGKNVVEVLYENPYRPESENERTIWNELTAPENYPALLRFIEHLTSQAQPLAELSSKRYAQLLREATSRWEQMKLTEENA